GDTDTEGSERRNRRIQVHRQLPRWHIDVCGAEHADRDQRRHDRRAVSQRPRGRLLLHTDIVCRRGHRGVGTTHPRGPDSYFLPQCDSAADSTIASACSALIAPEATNVCTDRATVETYCPWFFQATPAVGPLQDGSATPASENVVLNVPVPTMSV